MLGSAFSGLQLRHFTKTMPLFMEHAMLKRMNCLLPMVCTFACLAWLAPCRGENKAKDAVQGTWIPMEAEFAGQPFPQEVLKSMKLEIKDDQYIVTANNVTDTGKVKWDDSKSPKEVDITGSVGPNKGKTLMAIYAIDGDTMKVCYDLSGKARPKEFKTIAGTQTFLVKYKRDKK